MKAPRTLAPSDVDAGRDGRRVRVGGRVETARGRVLRLADALGDVRVELAGNADVAVGQLVVVEGRIRRGQIVDAAVIERFSGRPGDEAARFRGEAVGTNLAARARALAAIRRWFGAEGFVEVETPVRARSPGLDAHVHALRAEGGWLITSPELHMKRLVVGGLPRIFQLARVSRRDELGPWHEPEYTLLEWYRAFSEVAATMADTESIVRAVVVALTGSSTIAIGRRRIALDAPFARMTIREAFRKYARESDAVALAESDASAYFQLFVDRVEPALRRCRRPLFLTEFPACEGALARRKPSDPTVVERYELVIAGVELCNGYGELCDPVEQRARFAAERRRRRKAGERQQPSDAVFLAALEEGLPPCSGNALGVDRLVALALGVPSIAPVTAFPAT